MTAALTPGRRTLLTFGTPVSLLFIGYGALAIVNAIGLTHYTYAQDVTPTSQAITVKATEGALHLVPSPDSKVHVTVKGIYALEKPKVTISSTAAGISVRGSCPQFAVITCSQTITVEVPPAFRVTASSTAGDVRATGLTGPLDLSSTAGDVHADDVSGVLTLSSSAGDIHGTDLRSTNVRATSSAGDVDLEFVVPPTQVDAISTASDVNLRVPDVGYALSVATSGGDQHTSSIRTDPTSPRTIDAHSSGGDVNIKPNS